jgi:hypothetical protein
MNAGARLLRWFGAATVVLVAAAGLAVAVVERKYTCYHTCFPVDTVNSGWQYRHDSWQWNLQLGLALLGFMLAVMAVGLVLRDRPRPAVVCIVLSVLFFASWWSVLATAVL